MLYALGVGCASDPDEAGDLKFVYERGLAALPTMAVVLAYPGNWLESPASTADYSKVLHGEQALVLHRPLAPSGTVIGRTRNLDLLDKGAGQGCRAVHRAPDHRQGQRRADRHHDVDLHAARRRRLRRQGWPAAGTAQAPEVGADASRRHQGAGQRGTRLSPVRRPQPAARRSEGRRRRRLRQARSCTGCAPMASPAAPSSAPAAATIRRASPPCRCASPRPSIPARRSAPSYGPTASAYPSAPACWSATWWCSTTAWRASSERKRVPEIRHPQYFWHLLRSYTETSESA